MNTDLVKLVDCGKLTLNDHEDYCIESCFVGGRPEITMLEIKGDLKLSKDYKSYYINLAKIIESDVNLFRLSGVDISKDHKLSLYWIIARETRKIDDKKYNPILVQCMYKDYQGRPIEGQYGESNVISNVIVVEPSIKVD